MADSVDAGGIRPQLKGAFHERWGLWLVVALAVIFIVILALCEVGRTVITVARQASPTAVIQNTPSPASPAVTPSATPSPTATRTPIPTPTITPTPTPTPIILGPPQIRALGRLETIRYSLTTIVEGKQGSGGVLEWVGLGTVELVLIVPGEVIAGVDLTRVTAEDIQVQGDAVTLVLPAPEVLVTRIDPSRVRVYDLKQKLFAPAPDELELKLLTHAENNLRGQAVEAGILDGAKSVAEAQLTSWLYELGFRRVTIFWRAPAP
ncbi:MAG: DUF4230 domain-containing protein [Anaerolineae bacterium]|nr:DUF4230 domain-containing protein [Anaerolineae bacterium]MDH7475455.1 DUF4230 domain-containing protein [Anaerolineae bacterium]